MRDPLKGRRLGERDVSELSQALQDVVSETDRQVSVEGFTAEHDDQYTGYQLSRAGTAYALVASLDYERRASEALANLPPYIWPWSASWWKPKDRRRDLVRAAALLVKQIEQLDRAAGAEAKP